MMRAYYKKVGRGRNICCFGVNCARGSFRRWAKRNVGKRYRRTLKQEVKAAGMPIAIEECHA